MSLDWNAQKARLHDFYITKDMTLKAIIAIMKDEYQFKATKSQYENKFKAWGFHKYMTDEHWKFVDRRKRKYGDSMEVSFNGLRIPEKKVKRELSRHVPLVRLPSPGISPKTPEGLAVCFPTVSLTVDIVENLPWFRFRDFTESQVQFQVTPAGGDLLDNLRCVVNLNSWEPRETDHWGNLGGLSSTMYLAENCSDHTENSGLLEKFTDISDVLDHDMTALETFRSASPVSPLWQPKSYTEFFFSGIFAQDLFSVWQGIVTPVGVLTSPLCTESVFSTMSQLCDYIPERYDGEIAADCKQLISSSVNRVFLSFLGYAVYLSTNNLLESYQVNAMLNLLLQSKYFHAIVSFLKSELPTIEAFKQQLFQAAFHSCDKAANETLLAVGIDPTSITALFGPERHNAVSNNEIKLEQLLLRKGLDLNFRDPYWIRPGAQDLLASVSNIRMMRVLVDAGTDVNQPGHHHVTDGKFLWKTPLQHASSVGDVDIVRLLLHAGAEVNAPGLRSGGFSAGIVGVTALMAAVEENHLEVVELLLQSGANVNQYSSFADCAKYRYLDACQLPYMLSCKTYREGHVECTPLQVAARSGNLDLVQLLVRFGAYVNEMNQWAQYNKYPCPSNYSIFRKTALVEAVEIGHHNVAESLLNAGADVDKEVFSPFGTRAIHAACCHPGIQRLLDKFGAIEPVPSCIDLQLAVWRGDLERVEKLLNMGFDPDARALGDTDSGGRLTHMAVMRGHKALVKLLLGKGARMDHLISPTTCLQAATILSDLDVVVVLCHAGADVKATTAVTPYPPLQLCRPREGSLNDIDIVSTREIFRCLLQFGANAKIPSVPSERYGTPLQNAITLVEECDYDIVQSLLDFGVDVNAAGAPHTAFHYAISRADPTDDYKLIRILLDAGADVNQRMQDDFCIDATPLQQAVTMIHDREHLSKAGRHVQHMRLIELLLKSGAEINAPPGIDSAEFGPVLDRQRTALQEAADGEYAWEDLAHQDSELIEFLLKHGADVNAPPAEREGRTALQAASARKYCSIKIVQTLLEAGAEVNASACPTYGITALQGAAIQGHIKIAKMLMEAGAEVNASGSKREGRTALEGAAERGRLDMVQLLLNAGADTHLPIEKRYRSAADFAKKEHHFAIAKILMSYTEG